MLYAVCYYISIMLLQLSIHFEQFLATIYAIGRFHRNTKSQTERYIVRRK